MKRMLLSDSDEAGLRQEAKHGLLNSDKSSDQREFVVLSEWVDELVEEKEVRAVITRSGSSNGRIYMITLYHKDDYFDPIYLELFIIVATYGICGSLSASGPASMFQTGISNPET